MIPSHAAGMSQLSIDWLILIGLLAPSEMPNMTITANLPQKTKKLVIIQTVVQKLS